MKYFPRLLLDFPELEGGAKDTFRTCVSVKLSWADRIRIFLSGYMEVETKTVTENKVGRSNTNGAFWVPPPDWLIKRI